MSSGINLNRYTKRDILMKYRKPNLLIILLVFLYLTYQIYNFSYDVKYKIFGILGLDATTSMFLLLSALNIIINFVLLTKIYYLKSDSILWIDIFFGYNIFEMLIVTGYLIFGLNSISWFSPLDTIKAFGGRIISILLITAIVWIISRIYLKKELKN